MAQCGWTLAKGRTGLDWSLGRSEQGGDARERGRGERGRRKERQGSGQVAAERWISMVQIDWRSDPADRVYRGPGESRRTQKQTSTRPLSFCSRPVRFLQAPTTMSSPPSPAATAANQEGEEMLPTKTSRVEEEHQDEDQAPCDPWTYCYQSDDSESCLTPSPAAAANDSEDDPEDLTEEGLKARNAVLAVSKSVVALTASIVGADGNPPSTFACTGTAVSHEGSATWILTSAALIRKQGTDTEVHEASIAKIEVLLHNKKVVNGQLLMYDLQYNIAVVSIDIQADLPVVVITDLPVSYFLTPSPVVAIARKFESQSLQMKRGNTCRTISELDCNELMISTCQIEQVFIGGLLIDLEEKIVGMNFIDDETTPFLPVQVVRGCLTHFKKFREIKQPWLGIRGRALHMLELAKLEKICHRFPKPHSGILVDMIPEASRANCEGVEVGDILNQLDGVVLHSPGQLTAMLLDKMVVAMDIRKPVVIKALIRRPRDGTTFDADLKVMECPPGECDTLFKNRWTLPQPEMYYWAPAETGEWVDESD